MRLVSWNFFLFLFDVLFFWIFLFPGYKIVGADHDKFCFLDLFLFSGYKIVGADHDMIHDRLQAWMRYPPIKAVLLAAKNKFLFAPKNLFCSSGILQISKRNEAWFEIF